MQEPEPEEPEPTISPPSGVKNGNGAAGNGIKNGANGGAGNSGAVNGQKGGNGNGRVNGGNGGGNGGNGVKNGKGSPIIYLPHILNSIIEGVPDIQTDLSPEEVPTPDEAPDQPDDGGPGAEEQGPDDMQNMIPPTKGNGQRPTNGYGNGQRPGNGNGQRPGNGNGQRPGNGNGQRPGNGNGQRPGYGNGGGDHGGDGGHGDDGSYHHGDGDPIQWLRDAIRGEPGEDYPIFAEVPSTSFKCSDQELPGYYADVEARCQVFHICQADGRADAFLCPNGTIFSQMHFVCVWWYDFDCSTAESLYGLNANLFKQGVGIDGSPIETSGGAGGPVGPGAGKPIGAGNGGGYGPSGNGIDGGDGGDEGAGGDGGVAGPGPADGGDGGEGGAVDGGEDGAGDAIGGGVGGADEQTTGGPTPEEPAPGDGTKTPDQQDVQIADVTHQPVDVQEVDQVAVLDSRRVRLAVLGTRHGHLVRLAVPFREDQAA
ncbi:collagen alpha-1(I) chain-like isoform X1 [Dinothrombium tinctorium]|uniref:Collagen alpha-1(I) chain-like isoform X1 n=1 Tax=Dinothrombium tinctorium TaxID=1965070 RepID=A0A3S3SNP2_9ACAR|nr:collagen alpha-1(I) chain-like isoform X1 [Dinothrombium tinctorium]